MTNTAKKTVVKKEAAKKTNLVVVTEKTELENLKQALEVAEKKRKEAEAAKDKEKILVETEKKEKKVLQENYKRLLKEAKDENKLNKVDVQKRVEQTKFLLKLTEQRTATEAKIKELNEFIFDDSEAQLTLIGTSGQQFITVKSELLEIAQRQILIFLQNGLIKINEKIANFDI